MRILVTGASGFIGSQLVLRLRKQGHEVWEAMRYVSGGRFDYYEQGRRVFFDFRDTHEIREAVRKVKPETIINLAAMAAVSYSFDHTQEVAEVNYMGTVRICDAAREVGAWLIQASTSEVYGRTGNIFPLTEATSLGGTSPYAAAKVAVEEYLRVMQGTYQMPITIMRPFNTIGRALVKNNHYVVERAICQALTERKIELHDPRPLRDFVWREDHIAAYLAVVANRDKAVGETFNVCTGDCWGIEQMANKVAELVTPLGSGRQVLGVGPGFAYAGWLPGAPIPVFFSRVPDRPLDIPRLQGSNEKIRRVLGWVPRETITSALAKAVGEWHKIL